MNQCVFLQLSPINHIALAQALPRADRGSYPYIRIMQTYLISFIFQCILMFHSKPVFFLASLQSLHTAASSMRILDAQLSGIKTQEARWNINSRSSLELKLKKLSRIKTQEALWN
jgi:hypothetical protein